MPVALRLLGLGLAIPILVATIPAAAADVAPGRIRYSLCRSNVASTSVVVLGDSYGLLVQLGSEAKRDFANLIHRNPTKTVEVVFADRVLLRLPARSAQGGRMVVAIGDIEATQLALAEFEASLKESPCGLIREPDE